MFHLPLIIRRIVVISGEGTDRTTAILRWIFSEEVPALLGPGGARHRDWVIQEACSRA